MVKKNIPEYDNALEEADQHFFDGIQSVGNRQADGEKIDTELWAIQMLYNAAYWLARGEYGFDKKGLHEQVDEAYEVAVEHNKEDAADAKKGKKKD